MIKILLVFLLLITSNCFAYQQQYDGKTIEMNDKYSGKDFTNYKSDFTKEKIKNINIYGTCFYQDKEVDKHLFPEDMTGVTFYNCNLDNAYVPPGNTIIGGNKRKIKAKDGEDWLLNEDKTFKEPLSPISD